jgi:hypothetical protein
MVDLTRDVDEYFAELGMLEKILIEGKTKPQIAEVIALLKAVVEAPRGPASKAAMARLFERLE